MPIVQKKNKSNGYASEITKGLTWNIIEISVREGFNFITKLVLARLLLPEHFGIVGMAVVFSSFINVIADLGMGSALIQRKRDELNELHINTIFWSSTFFTLILYPFAAFGLGPLASYFYDQPEVYLVIVVLSIPVLLKPLMVTSRSLLMKEHNFKPIAIADIAGIVVAGIAGITAAIYGAGVWSIVILSVLQSFIITPLLWRSTNWSPKFEYSKEAFFSLFDFGKYITVNSVFSFITKNIDYLLVGKLLGAGPLGIYTLAFLLTDIVRSKVKSMFDKVFYPIFSDEQDNVDSIKKYYLLTVKFNALITFPFLMVLVLYANPIINLVLGEKWIEAIVPLQLLSVACMIHAIGGSVGMVLRALDKPKLNLHINIFNTTIISVPSILIGAHFFGLVGVAIAVIFIKLISRLIYQYYIYKLISCDEKDIFTALCPIFIGVISIILIYILYIFLQELGVYIFISSVIISLLVYSIILFILNKNDFIKVYNLISYR